MQLQSACGTYAYHFLVTPQGWNLVTLFHDEFYQPQPTASFADALGAKCRAEGLRHCRPCFTLDYVNGRLVNVAWASIVPDRFATDVILQHLESIKREYDLRLVDLIKEDLCAITLNGFNPIQSMRVDWLPSIVTPRSSSEPVVL